MSKNFKLFLTLNFGKTNCSSDLDELEVLIKDRELSRFLAFMKFDDKVSTDLAKRKKLIENRSSIVAKNMQHESFLRKLRERLEVSGIKIILLKSTGFNGYLYDSAHPRGNSDVDILVDETDLERLQIIIRNFAHPIEQEDTRPFLGLYENTWIIPDKKIVIDLHTSISNPLFFTFGSVDMFKRTINHPVFDSESILLLSNELNLVHLAIHIINDGYIWHHSLFDFCMIYKKFDVDEDELLYLAGATQSTKIVKFVCMVRDCIVDDSRQINSFTYKLVYKIMNYRLPKGSNLRRVQQLILQILLSDRILKTLKVQLIYIIKLFLFKKSRH